MMDLSGVDFSGANSNGVGGLSLQMVPIWRHSLVQPMAQLMVQPMAQLMALTCCYPNETPRRKSDTVSQRT
jgi:hypothetical protein